MRTRTIDADGPVHVAEFGGQGPPFVLLHGLGGSHLNWMRLGPLLGERGRVLAPDLAGFGRTPPAGRRTTVGANARLVSRLLDSWAGGPAILVGNSMGGLIGLLAAAARPEQVAGLVLLDPAIPVAPGVPRERQVTLSFAAQMVPGIGEAFVRRRLRRLGPEGMVRETFRMSCTDPSRIPPEVVEAHVDLLRWRTTQPWANPAVLTAARSMLALMLQRPRFRALVRRVRVPTLLAQGMDDRLITVAAALLVARSRPDWTFRPLPGIGHIPHLEDPELTAATIGEWLDGPGAAAWERAGGGAPATETAAG
ncbi:MAG TPA: alpha/beta hydrolase [Actinomycetota bacterium]|nr:alpha/beta hydrolase [Actinomycetota bacterium]